MCSELKTLSLPSKLNYMGQEIFDASGIVKITIPKDMYLIESGAFSNAVSLSDVEFERKEGWVVFNDDNLLDTPVDVSNSKINSTNLKSTYLRYTWLNRNV